MVFHYTFIQWVLFFFCYCLIGWIWECFYVSVRKREWVNRGFLHGPVLPIYGSGALIVLLCTISVRDQIGLIFLFGMVGATLLEYVTGACMERLFRVRYWDYSHLPLNVHGYICLPVSLGWGAFSVFLEFMCRLRRWFLEFQTGWRRLWRSSVPRFLRWILLSRLERQWICGTCWHV